MHAASAGIWPPESSADHDPATANHSANHSSNHSTTSRDRAVDTMIGSRSESRRRRRRARRLMAGGIACLVVGAAVLAVRVGGDRAVAARMSVPRPLDPAAVARAGDGTVHGRRDVEVRRDTTPAARDAARRALVSVARGSATAAEGRQAEAAAAARTAAADLDALRSRTGIDDPALAVHQEELVIQTLSARTGRSDPRIAPHQDALFDLKSLALQDRALERRAIRTTAAVADADQHLAKLRKVAAAAPIALITIDDSAGGDSPAPPQLVFGVAVLVLGAAALLAAGPARRRGRKRSRRAEPEWVPEPRGRRARRRAPQPARVGPRLADASAASRSRPTPEAASAPQPVSTPLEPAARMPPVPPAPTPPAPAPPAPAPAAPVPAATVPPGPPPAPPSDAPVPLRRPTPILPEPASRQREPLRIRVGNLAAPQRSRGAPFTVRAVRLVPSQHQRHGSIRPPE